MINSKARILISTILGKVCSILGYTIIFFMGLPLVFSAYGSDADTYVVVLFFIAFGIWLVISGIIIKRRIKRFKTYVGLISVDNITDLENLASSINKSLDYVSKDLQKMIDKNFFANAHIDKRTNAIVIGSYYPQDTELFPTEPTQPNEFIEKETVKCSGCGAMNMKEIGVAIYCEYCGSPIK